MSGNTFRFQQVDANQILPMNAIGMLPFSPEPLANWHVDNDLSRFLSALYNIETEMAIPDNERVALNYSFFGRLMFHDYREVFWDHAADFYSVARKKSKVVDFESMIQAGFEASLSSGEEVLDTRTTRFQELIIELGRKAVGADSHLVWNSESFGLMSKYAIAWICIVRAVLSEGHFFSLAHLLESEEELDCSILLSKNGYYKQAFQVLRSFLEHAVVQLYYCDREDDFDSWRAGQTRTPAMRGKKGMLTSLVSHGVIDQELSKNISILYDELNGFVHSSINTMLHGRLLESDSHTAVEFHHGRLEEWCLCLSRCVELAIPILRASVVQWAKAKEDHIFRCEHCGNRQFRHYEGEDNEGRLEVLECLACGRLHEVQGPVQEADQSTSSPTISD